MVGGGVYVLPNILSLVYYCLVYFEKKPKKTFFEESRPARSISSSYSVLSLPLVFSTNAHTRGYLRHMHGRGGAVL